MPTLTGILECGGCNELLAVFTLDTDAPFKHAYEDFMGNVCPKCGWLLSKESMSVSVVLENETQDVLNSARKAGLVYE